MSIIEAPVTKPAKKKAANSRGESGVGRANLLVRLVVLVLCVLWLLPSLGVLVTSFRNLDAANTTSWWNAILHPSTFGFTTSNYSDAINNAALGPAFMNSLAIALPATVIPILIAAFAGYAFTFMKFKFRDTIFILIVSMLVIPNYVAFVPMLKIYGNFHIAGTFPAAWLAHIGFGMSMAVYLIRSYMSTLPTSVIESAKIDGASDYQTFYRLVLPMSVPILASFAIFQFLWVWNDLLVALVFIGPGENAPITVATSQLMGQHSEGWNLVTAAGIITAILPIVVFLALQRYFIRGLTAGSVKG